MAYDMPNRIEYLIPGINFGSGNVTKYIKGPKGKRGRLHNYGVRNISVTFTNTSTEGIVSVGVDGATQRYGKNLLLGTSAAAAGEVSVRTLYADAADVAKLIPDDVQMIPADTVLHVTLTAPTGGSPAGTADVLVVVDWEL